MRTVTVSEKGQVVIPVQMRRQLGSLQEWAQVSDALGLHTDGLDFADALHLLASKHCNEFLTFDDKRFARRAGRMGLQPQVVVAN